MPTDAPSATDSVSSACVASFQPLCKCAQPVGILRVHPTGGDWEHRDGYIWCCTMVDKKPIAELWGVDEKLRLSQMRAIRNFLIAEGFTAARYERRGEWVTRDAVTGRTVQRK